MSGSPYNTQATYCQMIYNWQKAYQKQKIVNIFIDKISKKNISHIIKQNRLCQKENHHKSKDNFCHHSSQIFIQYFSKRCIWILVFQHTKQHQESNLKPKQKHRHQKPSTPVLSYKRDGNVKILLANVKIKIKMPTCHAFMVLSFIFINSVLIYVAKRLRPSLHFIYRHFEKRIFCIIKNER